jgi:GT2 family glycosyltransferase
MDRQPDISIVLVSYNVKQYLEQALDSIFKALTGLRSEIFVVDNGSGDGSAAMVKKRHSRVRLIENSTNVGFARANNQALSLARGRTICLINPDTLVREDTFRVCLDFLRTHPDAGVVGCKILNPDGTLQLACRRSFPSPWVAFTKVTGLSRLFPGSRVFGRYNLTFLDPDQTNEVEAISGSFMMVRKTAMDETGLLDEDFFLYGEDLDWCYRIRGKGWKIMYCPATQIVHYKGRSAQEASFDSLRVFYGAMRLFVKKHFRRGWSVLPQWFLVAGIGLRWLVSVLSRLARRLAVPFIDLVLMQAALVLALLIRFGELGYYGPRYRPVDAVYSLVWLACLYGMGLYEKGVFSASKAVSAVGMGLVINASLTFFLPQYAFSRWVVLTAGFLNVLSLSGWRLGIRFLSRMRRFPFFGTVGRMLVRRRAVLVGSGRAVRDLAGRLIRQIDAGYDVVGILAPDEKELARSGNEKVPVLGSIGDIARVCRVHKIRSVIFSPESVDYGRVLGLVAESKRLGVEFKMVPHGLDVVVGGVSIDSLDSVPLVDLEARLFSGPNRFVKRLGDILVPIFLSPAVLVVHLWARLHSAFGFKGTQIRDGYGGRTTIRRLVKRGKTIGGKAAGIALLWEVFTGKLTLVGDEIRPSGRGPRGLDPKDIDGPASGVKPGITGLVQVHADKRLSKEDKEKYKIYYLRNYSPLLDLEILLRALFR